MKTSELIDLLKQMPQDLEVHYPCDDEDYDYSPLQPDMVKVVKDSELVDENNKEEPTQKDILVIGDGYA